MFCDAILGDTAGSRSQPVAESPERVSPEVRYHPTHVMMLKFCCFDLISFKTLPFFKKTT